MSRLVDALVAIGLGMAAGAAGEESAFAIHRAAGPITIDGDLSDPGWQGAARFQDFVEIRPGDGTAPDRRTTLLLAYDEKFLYAAFVCEDPDPSRIRAAFSDRDDVGTDQDYAGIFLDTRHDRRTVVEFFANPHGVQYDAVQDDATGNEDSTADFHWDSAGRIDAHGWTLEIRIPFSSLRYDKADPQTWGIIAYRNYTRDTRHSVSTSRIPRGSPCFVCHERDLVGLSGLPPGPHYVLAPYAAASQEAVQDPSAGADSPLVQKPVRGQAGLDAKWIPTAGTAVDATLNPDFSQIESDVTQISVNSRFAIFYPEKRPFFLEGLELFATPIPAVYTRTITSPLWGLRGTVKDGSTAYTVLVTEDRGGGSVILPGPDSSDLAPQDFESFAAIGRIRQDLGRSFVSLLVTDREIRGGGYNRVLGPDFQWNPAESDQVTGQLLFSSTRNPDRPDLSPQWTGQSFDSRAMQFSWNHGTERWAWLLQYQDFGDGFRADDGYVPQVGYRRGLAQLFYRLYPTGFFSRVTPLLVEDDSVDTKGRTILQRLYPGVRFVGGANSDGEVDFFIDRVRAGASLFDRRQVSWNVELTPSSAFAHLAVTGIVGSDVDFVDNRPGWSSTLGVSANVRPTIHLILQLDASQQWLDVRAPDGIPSRLFTAQITRLKGTYNFNARAFLRLIGQYSTTNRDPSLYLQPVPAREGSFSGSALVGYRLNWQTVFFLGYGDDRALDEHADLVRTDRQAFLKISYAFLR